MIQTLSTHKSPIMDFQGAQDRIECLPRMSGLFLLKTMEDVQVIPVPIAHDIRPRYTWTVFRATEYLVLIICMSHLGYLRRIAFAARNIDRHKP